VKNYLYYNAGFPRKDREVVEKLARYMTHNSSIGIITNIQRFYVYAPAPACVSLLFHFFPVSFYNIARRLFNTIVDRKP
jgi:hypothetical protein